MTEPRRIGRPSRGLRVETKITREELAEVWSLVGEIGADRSEVLAVLIRRGLAVTRNQTLLAEIMGEDR